MLGLAMYRVLSTALIEHTGVAVKFNITMLFVYAITLRQYQKLKPNQSFRQHQNTLLLQ
jgi:hypothetical protein